MRTLVILSALALASCANVNAPAGPASCMGPGETGKVLAVSSDENCPADKDGWSCTSRARRGTLTVFVSFEMPDGSTRICSSRSMRYTALPVGTRFSAQGMTFLDGDRSAPSPAAKH